MKKISIILSAIALVLSSCSKSDDTPVVVDPGVVVPSNILLQKIKTSEGGILKNTDSFTYNGNKILEVTNTLGDKTKYTYTGNLITKIEEFSGTTLNYSETLIYNSSEKLTSYLKIDYDPVIGTTPTGFKVVYTYEASGDILFTAFTGSASSQITQNNTGKAFFTNSNITKIENYYPANVLGSLPYTTTETITYDNKIFSGINVTGLNKLTMQGTSLGLGGTTNNILTDNMKTGTVTTSTDESTYTYDTNNYPKTENNISKSYNSSGTISSTLNINNEYFY
jgi:hypothetical protein